MGGRSRGPGGTLHHPLLGKVPTYRKQGLVPVRFHEVHFHGQARECREVASLLCRFVPSLPKSFES